MRPISKVEAAGVVIFQKRSAKVLKFTIDDGTGLLGIPEPKNEKVFLTKLGKKCKERKIAKNVRRIRIATFLQKSTYVGASRNNC